MTEMSREERAFRDNPTAMAEAAAALRGEGLIEADPTAKEKLDRLKQQAGEQGVPAEQLLESLAQMRRGEGVREPTEAEAALLRSKMQTPGEELVEVDLDY
jgi:hypothetical protein